MRLHAYGDESHSTNHLIGGPRSILPVIDRVTDIVSWILVAGFACAVIALIR